MIGSQFNNEREKIVSAYYPDYQNAVGAPASSQMTFQKEKEERTSIMNNYLDIPAHDTFHRIPTHLEHNRYEATISRANSRAPINKSKESSFGHPGPNLPIDLVDFYIMKKDKSEQKNTQKLLISKLLFDQKN